MKIADLFRSLADKMDQIQGQSKIQKQEPLPHAQDASEEPPLSTMVPRYNKKLRC